MSFRPQKGLFAIILLVAATSVATSQNPSFSVPTVPASEPLVAGELLPERMHSGPASPAGTASQVGAAGDMIGFSHSDGSGTQTITLVHTGKPWMAVYHIDRSGKIRLVSSRPIDADFSLQLNATSPLPEEIRRIGR